MPRVLLTSPDQLIQLRLDPDPDDPGWWTIRHARTADHPAWTATVEARTPVRDHHRLHRRPDRSIRPAHRSARSLRPAARRRLAHATPPRQPRLLRQHRARLADRRPWPGSVEHRDRVDPGPDDLGGPCSLAPPRCT
ncbi:DUF317 domain-containing protein [Streptomyces sp. NPDC057298]|uniref:DUF317 domain-containing protein n=1 Tax=Streptomyces sp. NPDC057298 TaxID=3346091 RepID=UPI003629B24A